MLDQSTIAVQVGVVDSFLMTQVVSGSKYGGSKWRDNHGFRDGTWAQGREQDIQGNFDFSPSSLCNGHPWGPVNVSVERQDSSGSRGHVGREDHKTPVQEA